MNEILAKYWKEVAVTVMSTATLPFIRRYVRKQRAKMLLFFTEKKRLQQELADSENRRREAEARAEQEHTARVEAERKLQAEVEERRKAEAEVERLLGELEQKRTALEAAERKSQTKQEQKASEEAKPVPDTLTAKLIRLLKACWELPYPKEEINFSLLPYELSHFLPPTGDVLRMKVMRVINRYIGTKEWGTLAETRAKNECTVFYVLMLIAQGASEKQITIDDNAKLTWKKAGALLDKVNAEYFKEHPEAGKLGDYDIRQGKSLIANAFGVFPPEVVIEDKEFIACLLPATRELPAKTVTTGKGFFGRLFS